MFLKLWFPLLSFLAGWIVAWIQTKEPLLLKIRVLEKVKSQLESDLKWAQAKIGTQKLDLDRWEKKNWEWSKKSIEQLQEWPRANSYWTFEGPKLQQRVLDLEMELEKLRSQTLWRQD